jgi:hypothetical protein
MSGLLRLLFGLVVDLFRSRAALEVEIIVLRQQITVLRRGKPNRLTFMATDRLLLDWIYRLFPSAREASPSYDRRPSCAGIARAFDLTGAGSREAGRVALPYQRKSGN